MDTATPAPKKTVGWIPPTMGPMTLKVLGTCACGADATHSTRRGISPGKWTEPVLCCSKCLEETLPKVPAA